MVKCVICSRQAVRRSIYCPRCRALVVMKAESLKRREALIEAHDEGNDGFRCHHSGALLGTDGRGGPWALCFDHLVPRPSSRLVVSSELFNAMKSDLAPEEFPVLMRELRRRRAGEPFDRAVATFRFWTERKAPRAPAGSGRLRAEEKTALRSAACAVCGRRSRPHSIYCPSCRRLIFWGGKDHRPRVAALKRSWSAEEGAYLCHYTGVGLDDARPSSPWYPNIDHRTPGDEKDLVACASWVNAMKTDLSEDEFWAVVGEYCRYLEGGGGFRKDIAAFRYWKRTGPRG